MEKSFALLHQPGGGSHILLSLLLEQWGKYLSENRFHSWEGLDIQETMWEELDIEEPLWESLNIEQPLWESLDIDSSLWEAVEIEDPLRDILT